MLKFLTDIHHRYTHLRKKEKYSKITISIYVIKMILGILQI